MNDRRRHQGPNPRFILLFVAALVLARGIHRRREWRLAEGMAR